MLALWLTRLGIAVRIIDKNAGPADYSRALGVHARTLEFYRQLGFADEVVAGGIPGRGNQFLGQGRERRAGRNGRNRKGPDPVSVRPGFCPGRTRTALDRETVRARSPGRTQHRAGGLRAGRRHGARDASPGRRDRGTSVLRAYLAGCDGAHSVVRQTLAIDFHGETYSQLFYVADVEAGGPATEAGELFVDLDRADLLAIFPMKGKAHVRLVGTVPGQTVEREEDLAFEDVSHRVIEEMGLAIRRVNWFSPYRVHHRVAGSFRRGRAFLLGDAAHIHSPVGAQGMNTGIGDAVNLAWKLAAVCNGAAPESLLDTYESERIVFARRLVATTDRAFTFATKPGPIARFVRMRVVPAFVGSLMRWTVIRRFFFRTVSQLELNYRGGALSAGSAGKIQGGDRLPWVRTGTANEDDDNFAPLTSLGWQLHVYGEPTRGVTEACDGLSLPLIHFPWGPEMKEKGLARDAVYLVRPDGYVALADSEADPERLRRFFAERSLRSSSELSRPRSD